MISKEMRPGLNVVRTIINASKVSLTNLQTLSQLFKGKKMNSHFYNNRKFWTDEK